MKKYQLTALLLVLSIACSCAACGAKDTGNADKETIAVSAAEVPASSVLTTVDYSDISNWAIYEEGEGDADVFFLCPTVSMGSDTDWNASIEDENTKAGFLTTAKMELGIYDENAVVYVPYYEEATFAVYSLDQDEREPYMEIAYADVKAAFAYYLEQSDPDRPLILAGFSQGADMVIRLMKDYFNDDELADRLVAAYAIGWELTKEDVEENPWVVPAEGEIDTGCVITFSSEAENITESLMVPEDSWTYSINPLNWETDSTKADASLNKGACFTDSSGAIVKEIPNLTGAYIDEKRGTLKCTDIDPDIYTSSIFPDGVYHLYDYQFFYRNLQDNVAARLSAWERAH